MHPSRTARLLSFGSGRDRARLKLVTCRSSLILTLGFATTVVTAWASAWLFNADRAASSYFESTMTIPAQARHLEYFSDAETTDLRYEWVELTGSGATRYSTSRRDFLMHISPGLMDCMPSFVTFSDMPRRSALTIPKWIDRRLARPVSECTFVTADEYGWPLPALGWILESDVEHGPPVVAQWGIDLPPRSPSTRFPLTTNAHRRALPLYPLRKGLILNTLLYSAAWAALFIGLPCARRFRRRRRGHCEHCNYNLTGLSTCPECGAARTS